MLFYFNNYCIFLILTNETKLSNFVDSLIGKRLSESHRLAYIKFWSIEIVSILELCSLRLEHFRFSVDLFIFIHLTLEDRSVYPFSHRILWTESGVDPLPAFSFSHFLNASLRLLPLTLSPCPLSNSLLYWFFLFGWSPSIGERKNELRHALFLFFMSGLAKFLTIFNLSEIIFTLYSLISQIGKKTRWM